MFQPESYIASLIRLLQSSFGERLVYVGLQGSYLRGEATESSDIDIMTVVDAMTVADLDAYREAVTTLPDAHRSCGFICGREELRHWNPLEICHLLHTTKDYYGVLADLVPAYTRYDVAAYVKMSIGSLFHEICHRRIHAPMDQNIASLPDSCKQVFFILQNLHYLESGCFFGTKKALLAALCGRDKKVLEAALSFVHPSAAAFEKYFTLLYFWCQEGLRRTSSLIEAAQ